MAGGFTGDEARIRWLEEMVKLLLKRLESVEHKAGQASEDNARQQDPDAYGRIFIRCQSVGVVTGSTGAGIGTGTVRPLQLIGDTRYKIQPIAEGDITFEAVNDTGSPTIDHEYLIGAWIEGRFTLILGDCVTEDPAIAPDPPTG